jgi:hypothetical protein
MPSMYKAGIGSGIGALAGFMLAGGHWPLGVLAGLSVGILAVGTDWLLGRHRPLHRN